MARRRSNGEGTTVRIKGGWKAIFTISTNPRRTTSKQPFRSRADALAWLTQLKSERDAGILTPGPVQSSMLLCEWVESWLNEVNRDQSKSTYRAYKHHAEKFLVPALGRFSLSEIKPMAIRNLLANLNQEYGGRSTLQEIYKVAHICFEAAMKMELVARNPVDSVSRPSYQREEINPFTLAETREILAKSESHRLHGMFVIAFTLGLRQGELYALEWSDIDWDQKTMRIDKQAVNNSGKIEVKQPKTKAGRRTLILAEPVILAIRQRQAVAMSEGLAACPLVFPARRGGYVQRSSFAVRDWKPLLNRCGIDERGLHHTRHTFATHALVGGPGIEPSPLHVVSKILGHANPSITLNIYSHLIGTAQGETVSRVARLFAG